MSIVGNVNQEKQNKEEIAPGDRVLLVDDDPEVVWNVGRCLARAGFTVTTCGDGAEAIPLLQAKEFESVVTDIQMPRLNGLALLEWLHKNRPDTKAVAMTAFGSRSVQQVAMSKGAVLYLQKPVDPKILIDVLRSTPEKESSFSGNVDDVELFDYVQLMLVTRRQMLLEVISRDSQRGRLYIDGGNVVHAVCGRQRGQQAFYRCMSFHSGSFASLPWADPDENSIDVPGHFLLLEAARLKDEAIHEGRDPFADEEDGDPLDDFGTDAAFAELETKEIDTAALDLAGEAKENEQ